MLAILNASPAFPLACHSWPSHIGLPPLVLKSQSKDAFTDAPHAFGLSSSQTSCGLSILPYSHGFQERAWSRTTRPTTLHRKHGRVRRKPDLTSAMLGISMLAAVL